MIINDNIKFSLDNYTNPYDDGNSEFWGLIVKGAKLIGGAIKNKIAKNKETREELAAAQAAAALAAEEKAKQTKTYIIIGVIVVILIIIVVIVTKGNK